MSSPPRTPPGEAARRLCAAGFLDPALLGPSSPGSSLPGNATPPAGAGQVLGGRFELGPLLGRGAHGAVYAALDRASGREGALKLLSAPRPDAAARLEREGQLAAALDHPGLVALYEAGEVAGRRFLFYERVPGARSLDEALAGLSWPERLDCLEQVIAAVAHAHERGVVHRDLKPSNVLLDAEGRPRVADLGVGWGPDLETLTATGAAVGTPLYMAPEQIAGEAGRRDPGVDVWALGVLLYRCASGAPPFQGQDLTSLARAIVSGEHPPLARAAPHVASATASVIERCLRTDPAQRFPDAGALAAALARARARPERAGVRRLPLALLGVLLLGAALAALTQGASPPPPPAQRSPSARARRPAPLQRPTQPPAQRPAQPPARRPARRPAPAPRPRRGSRSTGCSRPSPART